MANRKFYVLSKAAGAVALALMLAACSGGDGNSRAELRKLAGVTEAPSATSLPSPTFQPSPTVTPDFGETKPVPTSQPVIVEVTQPAQIIEVTRVIEIVTTPTPDIQGFQDSGVDESVQPCPKPFWKRNRCVANDATVEAYASEVQP